MTRRLGYRRVRSACGITICSDHQRRLSRRLSDAPRPSTTAVASWQRSACCPRFSARRRSAEPHHTAVRRPTAVGGDSASFRRPGLRFSVWTTRRKDSRSVNLGVMRVASVCGSRPLSVARPEKRTVLSGGARRLAKGQLLPNARLTGGRRSSPPRENGRPHRSSGSASRPSRPCLGIELRTRTLWSTSTHPRTSTSWAREGKRRPAGHR